MDVGIDQSGDDGAAAEVDDARGGTCERADVGGTTDGGDLSIAHGERLRGCGVVDHDFAVEEDGVGGLRVSGDKANDNRATIARHVSRTQRIEAEPISA